MCTVYNIRVQHTYVRHNTVAGRVQSKGVGGDGGQEPSNSTLQREPRFLLLQVTQGVSTTTKLPARSFYYKSRLLLLLPDLAAAAGRGVAAAAAAV